MTGARLSRLWIAAIGAAVACAGCGFKGPLYLPERNPTVVTHPAQKNKGKTTQPSGSQPASSPPASQPQTSPPID